MNPTILIVDDEKHTREGIRASLEDNFEVYVAADIQGALNVMENDRVDLLVTDLRLGAEDGMVLIDKALGLAHPPICIMMTAYGSVDTAVEAMKHGAYDFVTKPLNLDKLEMLIRRALKSRDIESENVVLRQQVDQQFGLENIIGKSLAMDDIFKTIRQVAPSRANVLIQGESGTGKELVAHAIHNLSGRNKAKFVPVHCAALSAQLLESELFGHEKGAFTGATERRIGRFEQADGGTLFLDEIGEIDANTQIKLLRAVSEERSFERVGGNLPIKVDVRLVAATNKNLEKLVAEGKFRDDLFYRLNVVPITMPPLRDRKEDIPMLANAFLKKFAKENEKPVRQLEVEALEALLAYNWPGNVRELRTVIEHGVVMAPGERISLRDLPAAIRSNNGQPGIPGAASKLLAAGSEYLNLHDTEQRLMIRALSDCKGNVTAAAKKLGISRRTLQRKMKEMPNLRKSK
jgi:DNA-binding NtrC family response regulator